MGSQSKTVIVAGGTGALGRSVATAFLADGARVVVTYRNKSEFDEFARTAGANLTGAELDATDDSAAKRFADEIARHGSIDALIVTIGGYAGGKNLWETDKAAFDLMMNLNLRAAWAMSRAVAPIMIRQNRGTMVNVASRAGYGRAAGAALYAASKAGALALWDSLAEEMKPYNVNVNSIVPSIMDTPANRRAMPKADFAQWPKTEDIAKVVLFLCSEEARVIHGAAIPVYGRT
ncbi:MAG TPA: SDR family NAD(P)-dependent oxidoreductase [Candidatus Acidoferrales bacterium]|nr:SDR family NAD(P)-dependent oxidoreductase [Candidatus Acidoferrales bacterium]